jgi:hypothetical protein
MSMSSDKGYCTLDGKITVRNLSIKFFGLIIGITAMGSSCADSSSVSPKPKEKTSVSSDQSAKPAKEGTSAQLPIEKGPEPFPDVVEPKPVEGPDPIPPNPIIPIPEKKFNLAGALDLTSSFLRVGEISGWAVNKDSIKSYLSLSLYLDGDNKTGKKLGITQANLIGPDDNNGNEHAFYFEVPAQFIDGRSHKLYIYAINQDSEIILNSAVPYTLTFYAPKGGAAEMAFNKIGFNRCARCHDFNYNPLWRELVINSKSSKPWAADANYLYDRFRAKHQSGQHKGYTICTDNTCDLIKDWWRAEFN